MDHIAPPTIESEKKLQYIRECMLTLMNRIEMINEMCTMDLNFLQNYIDSDHKKDPKKYSVIKDQIIEYYAKQTEQCEIELCTYNTYFDMISDLVIKSEYTDMPIPDLAFAHNLTYFVSHILILDMPFIIHKSLINLFVDRLFDNIPETSFNNFAERLNYYMDYLEYDTYSDIKISLRPFDKFREMITNLGSNELHTCGMLRDRYYVMFDYIRRSSIAKDVPAYYLCVVKNKHHKEIPLHLFESFMRRNMEEIKEILKEYLKIFVEEYFNLLLKNPRIISTHIDYINKTYTDEFLHDIKILVIMQNELFKDQATFDRAKTEYLDKIEF